MTVRYINLFLQQHIPGGHRVVTFDPFVLHTTQAWTGIRNSVSAYTTRLAWELSEGEKKIMTKMGFNIGRRTNVSFAVNEHQESPGEVPQEPQESPGEVPQEPQEPQESQESPGEVPQEPQEPQESPGVPW